MSYERENELKSDALGVNNMIESGYNANAIIEVQKILRAVSDGSQRPEFLSTPPTHDNRI